MNRYDLSLLFSRTHSEQRSVLSVYLSVDQSQRGNLNRGFETRLKTMASLRRKSIFDDAERERYSVAIQHIREFLSAYRPTAKSIALFFDATDGFFTYYELEFVVTDQVHWDRELLLQPMANAIDQLEAYGVVLIDRARMRLFVVSLGEIEEVVHEDGDAKRVRHIKTVGFDEAGSASRIQRKADNQVRLNLRHVARSLDNLAKTRRVHRLVLLGTPEITAELRNILPVRLSLAVIGEAVAPINSPVGKVLSLSRPIAEKYELDTELEKVSRVVTSAAKGGESVVGLGRTLKALNAGRIWELIYAEGYLSPGYECSKCAALFSARPARCSYCNSRIRGIANVVERAVEHALRHGSKIEVVTGKASETLKGAGGIGGFLKTSTGLLQA